MKTTFAIIADNAYSSRIWSILKDTDIDTSKILYVCLHKTLKILLNQMEEENISSEKFIFIDTVTASKQEHTLSDCCTYLRSDYSLRLLEAVMMKMTKQENIDVIFFDSLSSIFGTRNPYEIHEFLDNLFNDLSSFQVSIIFVCLESDQNHLCAERLKSKAHRLIELK